MFAPAVALMNRLGYRRKFALISLLFALPLALFLFFMISESHTWIAFAEKERDGLEYNRHLRGLFDALEDHRGMTMAYASGDAALVAALRRTQLEIGVAITAVDRVDRELGGALRTRERWQALRARWLGLKDEVLSRSPREGFDAQTALIADVLGLVTHVGDTSNLIIDPELDSYYLMDTLITRLLRVVEDLGHARALGAGIATRRAATVEERIQLPALVGETRAAVSAMDRGLRVAFDVNPGLRPRLEGALGESVGATNQFLGTIEARLLGAGPIDIAPADYLAAGARAIDAAFHLYDLTAPALDELLRIRIDRYWRKIYLVGALVVLVLALVSYLFVGFYQAVMRTVSSLDEASRRMVGGDFDGAVQLDNRDELGRVVRSFNSVASRLRESEARTRLTVETALDAVIAMDAEGRIREWNPHAETIFGWTRAEAVGRRLSETIVPPQHREAHEQGLRRFLATGEGPVLNRRIEITACRRSGEEFPVELAISPLRSGETYAFSAFVRDIGERKRAEQRALAQHDATLVVAEAPTLAEAAPRLLQVICETVRWDVGALWQVDARAGVLRCAAIWRRPGVEVPEFEAVTRTAAFAPGVGIPGRVWAQGEPIWIPDAVRDPDLPRAPVAAREGLHGAFALPVVSRGNGARRPRVLQPGDRAARRRPGDDAARHRQPARTVQRAQAGRGGAGPLLLPLARHAVHRRHGRLLQAAEPGVREDPRDRRGRAARAPVPGVRPPGRPGLHRARAGPARAGSAPRVRASLPVRRRHVPVAGVDGASPGGGGAPLHVGARRHRAEADRGRAAGGQGRGRVGQPGQERVPRQHEPRAADAAERHHRLQRDAPGGGRGRRARMRSSATCRRSTGRESTSCR